MTSIAQCEGWSHRSYKIFGIRNL